MNRSGWWLLSSVPAALALWVAAGSSSLRAYGLNPGPGVRAVVVRIDGLSSDGRVAVASTVGTRARLIADADARGPRDVTLSPLQLWQSWRPQDWLGPSAQVCTYTLNLAPPLRAEEPMFQPGSLLWLRIPPAGVNACDARSDTRPDGNSAPLTPRQQEVGPVAVFSGNLPRALVLLLAFAWLLCLVHALVPGGRYGGVQRLLVGKDNRYSNAQFQMFAWFLAFIGGYVSTLAWRIASGNLQLAVGIVSPGTLLALTGLAAGTYGLAAVISAAGREGGLIRPQVAAPRLEDLYTDDAGRFDFGDFQSVIVTVVAVAGYLIALAGWQETVFLGASTTLPDVGATILTIFGAGQATYLLKKGLRADAIRDFGLTLQPDTLSVPAGASVPGALTLDVWHAPNMVLTDVRVTRQPLLPDGLPVPGVGSVSVPEAGAGRRVTTLREQYPVDLDTTGLSPGAYTFELTAGTPTRTDTVVGHFRVV